MNVAFRSLPTRGAWIEIWLVLLRRLRHRSLPTRGAWIEIKEVLAGLEAEYVAPHTGSVD